MSPASTAFGGTTAVTTPQKIWYGSSSSSYTLKITRGNCLPSISDTTAIYGHITIDYVLTNDRATTCSIRPYYSTDGGSTFSECTKGTGGDAKTGLGTSAAGTSHDFVWDSYTDLGNDFVGDVLVKIRAYDQDNYIGDFVDSGLEGISIMNAPSAATLVTPTDGYFQKDDTPEFVMQIPSDNNPTATYSYLHIKLEVDTTTDFNSANLVTFESRLDQTGWEYKNASSVWKAIPASGIPMSAALVGNQVRFVVPTDKRLDRTRLYWRVAFGGVA